MRQKARLHKLLQNLAQDFSIDKLSKSPARFNLEKLNWFNREYIKMMSLGEFAWQANQLKLQRRYLDKTLYPEVYLILLDQTGSKIYLEDETYMIGGRIVEGETELQSLVREVLKKTNNQVELEPNRVIKICDFHYVNDTTDSDGKHIHIYFYDKVQEQRLPDWAKMDSEGVLHNFSWIDFLDYLAQNKFITYPIWAEFCRNNNLKLINPNQTILQQYLGWMLDKNRVTVLSELGSESECITNWCPPETELLKWKKISLEESLANLKELKDVVLKLAMEFQTLQTQLYQAVEAEVYNQQSELVEPAFQTLVNTWDQAVKTWLSSNGKDIGSYLWPLRAALSGKAKSPSPFELLSILTLEQVQVRLDKSLN
jgi:glutamyl/glutaminyl-tRNA synthetase